MKKAVFMSAVLLTAALTGLVSAQAPTPEKLTLTPIGTTGYEAKALDKNVSGVVVIPDTYNNKPVTRVSGNGFRDCPGITGVVIPQNVTLIANAAFYNGSGLTSVTIPATVTKIENYAFQNCNNLTSVTFQSPTIDMNAGNNTVFPGDLVLAYQAGGAGTYSRAPRGTNWTKQGGYAPPPQQPVQGPPQGPPGGRRHFTINGIWTRSDGSQITINENGTIITITEGSGRFTRSYSER